MVKSRSKLGYPFYLNANDMGIFFFLVDFRNAIYRLEVSSALSEVILNWVCLILIAGVFQMEISTADGEA